MAFLGLFDWSMQSRDTSATTYKRQSGNLKTHFIFMHVLQLTTLNHMFFRFKITCTYVRLPLYEVKWVFLEEHLVIKNCHIAIASQISLNHISIRITRSHNQKTYSIKWNWKAKCLTSSISDTPWDKLYIVPHVKALECVYHTLGKEGPDSTFTIQNTHLKSTNFTSYIAKRT